MCFAGDFDGTNLGEPSHHRARKSRPCFDCGHAIQIGELYERHVWIYDGKIAVGELCERCQWLQARIYAEERAEGCAPGESWPDLGGGYLEEWYRERTWYLEDENGERNAAK